MLFWIFPTCREVFRMPKETLAVKKKKSGNIFRCDWHYAPWSTYAIIGIFTPTFSSGQFSRSVLSDSLWPMNRSMPGLPVHHHLPEFTESRQLWEILITLPPPQGSKHSLRALQSLWLSAELAMGFVSTSAQVQGSSLRWLCHIRGSVNSHKSHLSVRPSKFQSGKSFFQ